MDAEVDDCGNSKTFSGAEVTPWLRAEGNSTGAILRIATISCLMRGDALSDAGDGNGETGCISCFSEDSNLAAEGVYFCLVMF